MRPIFKNIEKGIVPGIDDFVDGLNDVMPLLNELIYTDQDEEWDGPDHISSTFSEFRTWLNIELGIKPARSPLYLIKKAMAASPDLISWIREWQHEKHGYCK